MSDPIFIESKEYDEHGNASPIIFVEYDDLRFMTYTREEAQEVIDRLNPASAECNCSLCQTNKRYKEAVKRSVDQMIKDGLGKP